MRKSFLVGNFLTAYGASFGRLKERTEPLEGFPDDKLALRFSERERAYRARLNRYTTRIMAGMVAALLVTILAFQLNIFSSDALAVDLSVQEVVQMEEIVQTQQEERPPPPPRPPVPVEVPDDIVLEDDKLVFDATLDLDAAIFDLPPPTSSGREGGRYGRDFLCRRRDAGNDRGIGGPSNRSSLSADGPKGRTRGDRDCQGNHRRRGLSTGARGTPLGPGPTRRSGPSCFRNSR